MKKELLIGGSCLGVGFIGGVIWCKKVIEEALEQEFQERKRNRKVNYSDSVRNSSGKYPWMSKLDDPVLERRAQIIANDDVMDEIKNEPALKDNEEVLNNYKRDALFRARRFVSAKHGLVTEGGEENEK